LNFNRLLCVAAALALVTTLAACGSSSKDGYVSKADQRRDLMAKAQAGDAEARRAGCAVPRTRVNRERNITSARSMPRASATKVWADA
jgi:hypothetical protein